MKFERGTRRDPLFIAGLVLVFGIVLILFLAGATALAAPARVTGCNPPPSTAKLAELPREYPRFYRALRSTRGFGSSWREAAVVAWREATWHAWARNGQYRGTFQLGAVERSSYGHGATLAEQVYAAARLWRARHWQPWECKP